MTVIASRANARGNLLNDASFGLVLYPVKQIVIPNYSEIATFSYEKSCNNGLNIAISRMVELHPTVNP